VIRHDELLEPGIEPLRLRQVQADNREEAVMPQPRSIAAASTTTVYRHPVSIQA
jgi:hypothetical protein